MLLAHSSGLPAYEKLFLRVKTRAELLAAAFTAPLSADPGTRVAYSDIGFITLAAALERIADETLDRFCQRELFGPLGMVHTAYNPPATWRDSIPPTADDRNFRNRVIRAKFRMKTPRSWRRGWTCRFVCHGGRSGHIRSRPAASRADYRRPSKLRPEILRPETLAVFLAGNLAVRHFRALGWDTPSSPSQSGKYFSATSRHLGYTGTSL
jgi:CubicO group peptidase (beta-lactamase class C family)